MFVQINKCCRKTSKICNFLGAQYYQLKVSCKNQLQKSILLRYDLQMKKEEKMKIGYARVSTTDQNLEIQLTALKEAGCKRIYQEKISGVQKDRPELKRLIDQLRAEDVVVVLKLDRLARSTQHLLDLVEQIRIAEASFCSLSEPWADTTTHAGKMIMTVFAGIAEFERELIRERTSAGRKAALTRGVRFGRPKKMNEDKKLLVKHLLNEGKSISDIASTFNVHNATIYRLLNKEDS
jgi:DNA invertase Pin-like site-specific DNA recombinase